MLLTTIGYNSESQTLVGMCSFLTKFIYRYILDYIYIYSHLFSNEQFYGANAFKIRDIRILLDNCKQIFSPSVSKYLTSPMQRILKYCQINTK